MKSFSIAALLIMAVTFNSVAGGTPNFKGIDHLRRTYPEATQIEYKTAGAFTEVNFTWQGIHLVVWYDKEGNPVATSRAIKEENMPVAVQLGLHRNYPDYSFHEAIEFSDDDTTCSYYVTVVNKKLTLVLHVSTDGSCSVFKKMKS